MRIAREGGVAGAEGTGQLRQVKEALGSLPEELRVPIELAYFGGHTYREVAAMLEEPEGTVKSRIRSGLGRLRSNLADRGVAPAGADL